MTATTAFYDLALVAGRILLGGFFLLSGIRHLTDADTLAQYAGSKGLPAPKLAVLGTGLLLLAGAASVLAGFLPRLGLGLLALFLVAVTPVMHDYWTLGEAQARQAEQTQFLKNAALLGATLALMSLPTPWAYALAA